MTNIPPPSTQSIETISPKEAFVARVDNITGHILHSKQYELLRHEGYSHTEAFTSLAHHSAANKESRLAPSDRAVLEATSQLGGLVAAVNDLRELRIKRDYSGLDDEQLNQLHALKKAHITPFNHSLKAIVSTSPNLDLYTVAESLGNTYEKIFFREHAQQRLSGRTTGTQAKSFLDRSRQEILDSLDGMRHEGAAEAMLTAQGIDCISDVNVAQDIIGVDMLVSFDNNNPVKDDQTKWSKIAAELGLHGWLELDIKSSEKQATDKRRRHPLKLAVATGLTYEDFTGTKNGGKNLLGISYDTAVTKGATFVENIIEVAHSAHQSREKIRRSIAARSTQDSEKQ